MTQIFENDFHERRVLSLANGVAGVLSAAALSVHAIGQAYAAVAEIQPKSGVKQVDRLLSNAGLPLDVLMRPWVRHVVGAQTQVLLAMDWTDFELDDHTTLCVYLVSTRGRAMPLAWKTIKKSELAGQQTALEEDMVRKLHEWLPAETEVTLLADRGFAKQELYKLLESLHWDYVIRFRETIFVEAPDGKRLKGGGFVCPTGQARIIRDARVTADGVQVGAVVTVKQRRMKQAWCLATSLRDAKASDVIKLYSRRFTIEETFRDTKDLHFGLGLSATHIRSAARRDRLLLLVAIAHTLLTLLGAAAEEAGLDRYLKANTVKRRTHSLFRQGSYWFRCIPTMRDEWFRPLIIAFDRLVREQEFFNHFFAAAFPGFQATK